VQKFPGSPGVKVFAGVTLILAISGRNTVFKSSSSGKQGEHYFSQERPEQVVQAQEKSRKEYMEARKVRQQAQEQSSQQN